MDKSLYPFSYIDSSEQRGPLAPLLYATVDDGLIYVVNRQMQLSNVRGIVLPRVYYLAPNWDENVQDIAKECL